MTLAEAQIDKVYSIKEIKSDDNELIKFLFSLGCYSGESIKVITKKKNNVVMKIKEARYNIDIDLAKAILI